jgi:uncharacterized protein YdaU (DUF1376 family)
VKAPAFQCYAADFLADKNVMVMSAEEVGAYWLLILVCWREGVLPNDMEELAALARIPIERFEPSWNKRIARCFEQNLEGEWVHPRLEKERHKQDENREKKRYAANKRHHPATAETSTSNADAMHMHSTSNAFQSSSSSSTAEKERAPNGDGEAPPKSPDVIWGLGRQMLVRGGMSDRNAGVLLGDLSKKHGKERLAQAIATTSAANPADTQSYLIKILKKPPNENGKSPPVVTGSDIETMQRERSQKARTG